MWLMPQLKRPKNMTVNDDLTEAGGSVNKSRLFYNYMEAPAWWLG